MGPAIRTRAAAMATDNSLGINPDVAMQRRLAELTAIRFKDPQVVRVARVV